MSEPGISERSARVSTLELFFDLVFVFTITQLTSVLVAGGDAAAAVQVVVMLLLVWWMYDGYAWLTNAIATDRLRYRIALIGGMGGFLIGALAIPDAYESDGLAFGLAYLAVVLLHGAMYAKGTSVSEVAAILRIVPYNLTTAGLVVLGGALGGNAQWVLWTGAAVLIWCTPWLTGTEGFLVSASHFVERHGLVIIVALGESVVVIGVGAADLPLDLELVVVALLGLALSASLWWLYFRGEDDVERAMEIAETVEARSPRSPGVRLLALRASARRRRRGRRAEEGGRASVRRARHVGWRGARGRCCALRRLHGRVPCDARTRDQPSTAARGGRRTCDDSARPALVGARAARRAHGDRRCCACSGGTQRVVAVELTPALSA
jgi:hypothetical protein